VHFELVDQSKWSTSQSIKALTQLINRKLTLKRNVSDNSVGRALDGWYTETGERRFFDLEGRAGTKRHSWPGAVPVRLN